jgi:hypothetical protein
VRGILVQRRKQHAGDEAGRAGAQVDCGGEAVEEEQAHANPVERLPCCGYPAAKQQGAWRRWDISPIEQMRFWPAEGKPLRWWLEEG